MAHSSRVTLINNNHHHLHLGTKKFSSLNPLFFLQPHNAQSLHFLHSKPIQVSTFQCCSSSKSSRVDVSKTKRKPRPSFIKQVQDKWSVKLPSQREKFPWQVQDFNDEEKEEVGDGVKSSTGVAVSQQPVGFAVSNTYVPAPWIVKKKPSDDAQVCSKSESLKIGCDDEKFDGVGLDSESYDKDEIFIVDELIKPDKTPVDYGESLPIGADNIMGEGIGRGFSGNSEISAEKEEFVEIDEALASLVDEKQAQFESLNDNVSVRGKSERFPLEGTGGLDSVEEGKEKGNAIKTELTEFGSLDGKFSSGEDSDQLQLEGTIGLKSMEEGKQKGKNTGSEQFGSLNGNISSREDLDRLPWEGSGGLDSMEEEKEKRSNTELAESILPEHELRRLRNVALRMYERIKVGSAGITQALVASIHEKWKFDEVVKLKFELPLSLNMKRTHEILENKTGGLVIWRSGSSVVLFRGMNYKLLCVQSYSKKNQVEHNVLPHSEVVKTHNVGVLDTVRPVKSTVPESKNYMKGLSKEEILDLYELNLLLDELGPRFKDWTGCEPLPVDADLLPPVVPGYKPPFRLLAHGIRLRLLDRETTEFRRLARTMPPHFALGRNRELQGLAKAIVKLWENSAIAKIAIKRGVENTRNERMAEELKTLTGGTLLSRNKEYIVMYRGNDFLPPAVREVVKERINETILQQDGEELAWQTAQTMIESRAKASTSPLVAGTLSETMAAISRWGRHPSSEEFKEMKKESTLTGQESLVKSLEKKLAFAKWKFRMAERALAKVQMELDPADIPTDLETITNEERFLFRKMGLSMKPFLPLGRRGVYDGTIQNMHLHWKYRELVKIIVKRKNLAQVKHIAISLEAESGGVLVSVDNTTKGYAIIVYRGKNYRRPQALKPQNLLTKRQAFSRSIELQRCEALKHHISDMQGKLDLAKSKLERMKTDKIIHSGNNL